MANKYFNHDTIAAIVTAPNAVAGLGVIRVSGPLAWDATGGLLRSVNKGAQLFPGEVQSHCLHRCLVVAAGGQALDDAMFVYMKGPRSFTGEDVVELHLHGNPLLLRRVMNELQIRGAREALPGEFSFRAFRNGKISLDQAESIADLISSRSEESSRRALSLLIGRPKEELAGLKRALVDRLAEVEIDIDFSDQGLSSFDPLAWCKQLEDWALRVQRIRDEFIRTRPLREGIRLALVGEPNGGKSSLFNRLLGEERSIVSREAGTTRDVVRESIEFGGLLFKISDTAGIRSTGNEIEAEGIQRSFGEVSLANVVLWVLDGSQPESSMLEKLRVSFEEIKMNLNGAGNLVAVWNKSDLAVPPDHKILDFFRDLGVPVVSVSAKTGAGVESLMATITDLFLLKGEDQPDFSIGRMRHFEVLGRAVGSVRNAIGRVQSGELFPDLLASDLRSALSSLGEISGEFTSDDLLNHIFAEFCIGK